MTDLACSMCNAWFQSSYSLLRHYWNLHCFNKTFHAKCTHCGSTFKKFISFKSHLKRNHQAIEEKCPALKDDYVDYQDYERVDNQEAEEQSPDKDI